MEQYKEINGIGYTLVGPGADVRGQHLFAAPGLDEPNRDHGVVGAHIDGPCPRRDKLGHGGKAW